MTAMLDDVLGTEESRSRASKPVCMSSVAHTLMPRVYKNGNIRTGRERLESPPVPPLRMEEVFSVISGAGMNPYHTYALEARTGWTMHPGRKTLPEITGIALERPDGER